MSKIIVSMNDEHIIGIDGKMPWHYPGDLRFFKEQTDDGTVIMGRNTYYSIGHPLPNRLNIVVTSQKIEGVICIPSVKEAHLFATQTEHKHNKNVWFIGGVYVYQEAFDYADTMYITFVPNKINITQDNKVIKFPIFPYKDFNYVSNHSHPYDDALRIIVYKRSYNEQ